MMAKSTMGDRKIGTNREIGPGERASKAQSRRMMLTYGGLMLGGVVLGLVLSFLEHEVPAGIGTFPPAFAIGTVVFYLVLIAGGCWRYYRSIDELELKNNYVGAIWGVNIYMTLYPCWYLLWKGGMVAEPMHDTLFVITVAATMVAYFWHKFRF